MSFLVCERQKVLPKIHFQERISLLIGKNKKVLGESEDFRESSGENPVYSSIMMAMGKAKNKLKKARIKFF